MSSSDTICVVSFRWNGGVDIGRKDTVLTLFLCRDEALPVSEQRTGGYPRDDDDPLIQENVDPGSNPYQSPYRY